MVLTEGGLGVGWTGGRVVGGRPCRGEGCLFQFTCVWPSYLSSLGGMGGVGRGPDRHCSAEQL